MRSHFNYLNYRAYLQYKNVANRRDYAFLDDYCGFSVGGGSGGATLAARLSEDPDTYVLLLEAGLAEYPESEIPSNTGILKTSPVDWNFKPEPELYCCEAFKNKVNSNPRRAFDFQIFRVCDFQCCFSKPMFLDVVLAQR